MAVAIDEVLINWSLTTEYSGGRCDLSCLLCSLALFEGQLAVDASQSSIGP